MLKDYKYLIVPVMTLLICQILKFIIESIINKKLVWGRLVNGTGGMPSSHTSFSMSLTTMIGLNEGFNSPLFAIALTFTLIVSYDAMGLRMQSGKQAEAINKIFDELFKNGNISKLKEKLGHKPQEVLAGMILGIISAIFFTYKVFI